MGLGIPTYEKELQQGRLPKRLLDDLQLLSPESNDGKAFQHEGEQVLKRLMGDRFDPVNKPVRFLLSSSPMPNAFLINHAVPPTVGISMGMLRLIEAENEVVSERKVGAEDQLAGLIEHELGHDFFNANLGLERSISKGEEAVSDLRTLATLRDASPPYHQAGLLALMRKFPQADFEAWYRTASDEHPNKGNRLRMMESAGAILNRERGGPQADLAPTPFSPGLTAVIGRVTSSTRLGNYLHARNYEHDTVVGKLNTLDELFRTQLNGPTEYGAAEPDKREVLDLVGSLGHLKIDRNKPAEAEAVQRLVKTMLMFSHGHPAQDAEHYAAEVSRNGYVGGMHLMAGPEDQQKVDLQIRQGDGGFMFLPSMPAVKEPADAIDAFVKAKTPAAAETAARHLVEVSRKYDPHTLKNIALPTFSISDKALKAASPDEPMELPWHRHEQWALARPGSPILDGLMLLGADGHPELEKRARERQKELAPPPEDHEPFVIGPQERDPRDPDDKQLIRMATLQHDSDYGGPSRVTYTDGKLYHLGWRVLSLTDDQGHAIGPPIKEREPDEVTPDQSKFRDMLEKSMLPSVDWHGLEEDFAGFTKAYKRELRPNYGLEEAENPFAHAFLNHLMALQRHDPEKWNPVIHQFFTGKDAANGSVTFPALLADSAFPLHEFEQYSSPTEGISVHHPLVKFVEQDPLRLFSLKEKLAVIDYCRHATSHHTSVYDYIPDIEERPHLTSAFVRISPRIMSDPKYEWHLDNKAVFGFDPPKTAAELKALYERVAQDPEFKGAYQHQATIHALQHETLSFLRGSAETPSAKIIPPDLQRDIHRLVEIEASHKGSGGSQLSVMKPGDHAQLQKEALSKNIGTERLLETYRSYATDTPVGQYFFDHPGLREKMEGELLNHLKRTENPASRLEIVTTLLSPQHFAASPLMQYVDREERSLYPNRFQRVTERECHYEANLASPALRRFALDSYAADTAAMLGKDDGSQDYAEKFKAMADQVMSTVNLSYALEILPKIAELTETQRELSYFVRDKVKGGGLQQIVNGRFIHILGETAINELVQRDEERKATLDFLTRPLTAASIKTFSEVTRFHTGGERAEEAARLVHRNFWDLPFEGRTLAMEMLLFPAQDKTAEGLQRNISYALDKALPLDTSTQERSWVPTPRNVRRYLSGASSLNSEQNHVGRDVIDAYLQVSDVPERRLLMAAMLVAQPPEEGKVGDMGVGEALRLILDNGLGPAGRKLAQAIHSHPATPEEIRKDMSASKSMAAKPYRWQLFEWLDKDGPKPTDDAGRITHVGAILGAGAYGVTYEATRQDGSRSAITQLRPYVREQAQHGFANLGSAAESLIAKRPALEPVTDMISQAKQMSTVETDMDMAAHQAKNAERIYHGLTVHVDGRNIRFSTAPWRGHGPQYKETAIIEGAHFNDLPPGRDKTVMAKAILTSEILALLKGGPFDHDRHGAQQRIDGDHVGNFDFGAMSLQPMTMRQKQLVGDVFSGVLQDLMHARNPVKALAGRIKTLGQTPEDHDFLASLERTVLAWNDYIPSAGMTGLAGAFTAVVSSGEVDHVITDRMRVDLGDTGYQRAKKGLSLVGRGVSFSYSDGGPKNDTSFGRAG